MIWIGVLAVGLVALLSGRCPFCLVPDLQLPERTQAILRHAGMGGIAALLISDILGIGSGNGFWDHRLDSGRSGRRCGCRLARWVNDPCRIDQAALSMWGWI